MALTNRTGFRVVLVSLVTLVTLVTLAACAGEPTRPSPDGGMGPDGGSDVAPPNIPWLADGLPPLVPPTLTPCPVGWHEVVDAADVITCDPYANEAGDESGPDDCPVGWAHFVGEETCSPIGDPCPAGNFPDDLPTDVPVIHVLAAAAPGGDGSRGAPLSTITEAMGMAWSGAVVAIGKGEYDEALRPRAGVTLWGACAAETRLRVSSPDRFALAIIMVRDSGVVLKNLHLGSADLPGLAVLGADAEVSVDGLLIRDVQNIGLVVAGGGRVRGSDVMISDTRSLGGPSGQGITIESGGTVDLTRVLLARNLHLGVFASGAGTSITLGEALIHDSQGSLGTGADGRGLAVQGGAAATLSATLISHNHGLGVYVAGEGSEVTLSQVVVRDTRGYDSDGAGGGGLTIQNGARAEVTRTTLARNREFGVFVAGEGASATLSDVVVRDTKGRESDGQGGRGLNVQDGPTVVVTSAVLSRNRDIAMHASGVGTSVRLSEVIVQHTRARESDGRFGRGLNVQRGATVEVSGALISQNRNVGAVVDGADTLLELSDIVIRDTQERQSDRRGGRGLVAQNSATVEARRVLLSGNRDFGIAAADDGTVVTLSDVVVTETEAQACAQTLCPDRPSGVGLGAFSRARLGVARFAVLNSALCGVMLAGEAQVDLSVGQVAGSPVGVCLQVDGYSLARLSDRVMYQDNGMNITATNLPVPEPAEIVSAD